MENEVKEPVPKYGYISPEEYFEMEEQSDERLEYYDGFVAALESVGVSHARISVNLVSKIDTHLKEKRCEVLHSTVKIYAPSKNSYVYPDATIFCDPLEIHDENRGTILNPSVVFEILSKSTEKKDYSFKFLLYKSIPSVKEYIMIDSKKRYVSIARREGPNLWSFDELTKRDEELYIRTIDLRIPLDDLYRNILLKFSA